MNKLTDLPNIGKELEKQLLSVGITSYEELAEIGSTEAWLRIKRIDSSACINRLMGLEGAIQKKRRHQLSETDKDYLKEFYKKNKSV